MLTAELRSFIYRSLIFFSALTLIILVTVKLWPASELLLFEEDGIIETATATAAAIAALLGSYAIWQGQLSGKDWFQRMVLIIIPSLALFCFLDEISWGARLFDLQMPIMEGGGEFDGVHDVIVMLERSIKAADPILVSTMTMVTLALTLLLACRHQTWLRKFLARTLADAQARRLGAAIGLLAFATVLDLMHGRIIYSLEEFSELCASLYLLLAGYRSQRQARQVLPAPAASANAVG